MHTHTWAIKPHQMNPIKCGAKAHKMYRKTCEIRELCGKIQFKSKAF